MDYPASVESGESSDFIMYLFMQSENSFGRLPYFPEYLKTFQIMDYTMTNIQKISRLKIMDFENLESMIFFWITWWNIQFGQIVDMCLIASELKANKKYGITLKITLTLSEGSVNFFKAKAEKHGLKYQQMIRSLIDKYVSAHTHSS